MHGQGLSRQAAKQNRTLELEITLAPRSRNGVPEEGGSRGFTSTYRHRDTQNEFDTPEQRQRNESVFTTVAPTRVIDARNEQEFPSLGGASATTTFTLRPNVSLMPRSYGTGGIARTQENFPALGGGSSAAATPSTSGSYRQGSASAMLKKPGPKTVIHVSNRPNPAKKPEVKSGQDFPSLPGSSTAKSKKSTSLFLDEDFVPLPSSSSGYSSNIASKHRSLANGYEAFAADATAKLGLIKLAEATQVVPKRTSESAPKLNSNQSFPTLGNAPSAALAAQWVTLGKKAPVESRKSKVAPAPLATASTSKASAKTTAVASTNKKEITKAKPSEKPNSAPPAAAKNQKKVKNYNPFEEDSDEEKQEYVPSASVLSAVSAKHRSLVDSYESIVKPGVGGGNKLAMVTRSDNVTVSNGKSSIAAPKLNSKDNFPSLSGSSGSAARNGPSINFLEIMKASNENGGQATNIAKKTSQNNNNDGHIGNLNGPPPGFGGGAAPPPGFKSVTLNSVAKSSNNLTFTTSLGEQFTILPAAPSLQYQYLPPNNSSKRNQVIRLVR